MSQPSVASLVEAWYRLLPKPVRNRPTLAVPESEVTQVLSLLKEEVAELEGAMSDGEIIRVADALADIVYVAYGAALQFGFDLDRVLEEVHASNMSKHFEDGHYEFEDDGKVVRGSSYRRPNLEPIIAKGRGGAR